MLQWVLNMLANWKFQEVWQCFFVFKVGTCHIFLYCDQHVTSFFPGVKPIIFLFCCFIWTYCLSFNTLQLVTPPTYIITVIYIYINIYYIYIYIYIYQWAREKAAGFSVATLNLNRIRWNFHQIFQNYWTWEIWQSFDENEDCCWWLHQKLNR